MISACYISFSNSLQHADWKNGEVRLMLYQTGSKFPTHGTSAIKLYPRIARYNLTYNGPALPTYIMVAL